MTTVGDIYSYIDSIAPFSTAADFDNAGLLIGGAQLPVARVIVSLDITPQVAHEAHNLGAQLVVSHHPIIFNPLKNIAFDSAPALLVKYGIAALCAHTNLDKSLEFGVNTCLASACGLVNIAKPDPMKFLFTADTTQTLTAAQLAQQIKRGLSCESLAYTDSGKVIRKVGLCSGAGGDEIFAAAAAGCDAFITGEMKHHEILAANELSVSSYIVGHYRSEDIVIAPLAQRLAEKFPQVTFVKSEIYSDGVLFL